MPTPNDAPAQEGTQHCDDCGASYVGWTVLEILDHERTERLKRYLYGDRRWDWPDERKGRGILAVTDRTDAPAPPPGERLAALLDRWATQAYFGPDDTPLDGYGQEVLRVAARALRGPAPLHAEGQSPHYFGPDGSGAATGTKNLGRGQAGGRSPGLDTPVAGESRATVRGEIVPASPAPVSCVPCPVREATQRESEQHWGAWLLDALLTHCWQLHGDAYGNEWLECAACLATAEVETEPGERQHATNCELSDLPFRTPAPVSCVLVCPVLKAATDLAAFEMDDTGWEEAYHKLVDALAQPCPSGEPSEAATRDEVWEQAALRLEREAVAWRQKYFPESRYFMTLAAEFRRQKSERDQGGEQREPATIGATGTYGTGPAGLEPATPDNAYPAAPDETSAFPVAHHGPPRTKTPNRPSRVATKRQRTFHRKGRK
jgi:hypothetical protein